MVKKNNLNLFKTNVALVITAMFVGLIVSIIAQFFSLTAKWVFKNFQSIISKKNRVIYVNNKCF